MPRSNSAAEDTAAATEAPYASTSKPRNHRRRRRRPHNPPPPLAAPPAAIADSSLVPATLQAWGSSGWTTSRSNSTQHLPATLHLLTYNIWSSSLSHTPSQDLALLRILSSSPADIIALQELSQSFYSTLLRQSWLQRDWLVTDWQAFRDAGDLELPPPTRDGKRPPKGKPGEEEAVVLLVKRKLWTEGSTASFLPLPRATADQPKAAILLHLRDATGSVSLRIIASRSLRCLTLFPPSGGLRRNFALHLPPYALHPPTHSNLSSSRSPSTSITHLHYLPPPRHQHHYPINRTRSSPLLFFHRRRSVSQMRETYLWDSVPVPFVWSG